MHSAAPTYSQNYISYNGYYYSTLANVYPDGSYSYYYGCQYNYLSVPTGWELAPYASDSIAVIKAHQWSTYYVVLGNGYTYFTAASDYAGQFFANSGLNTYGYTYSASFCYSEILIRRL